MENPEIIRFQLDGFGRDLERGDLKRESKSLTAEGVFSFKTKLRANKMVRISNREIRWCNALQVRSAVVTIYFLIYTLCHVYSSKLVDHNCCKMRLDATRSISGVSKGFYH